jgi:hypothetical protein
MRTVTLAAGLVLSLFVGPAALAGPWASEVVEYRPGTYPQDGYTNAAAALGPVSTHTGAPPWDGPVTMFNAPYLADQTVSIGPNGSLVVRFDIPVTDLPGPDFIVYGNAGFTDPVWDDLTLDIGDPAALYGADGGRVDVSPDNVNWMTLAGTADGLFPTQPWLDTEATLPARFGKPLPQDLTLADFNGLSFADALLLYQGSAGGAGFDIASSGWSQIHYVRIVNDGTYTTGDFTTEIDALRVVPEPATLALLALGILACALPRKG